MEQDNVVLELKNMKVHFHLDEGILKAVDGVDLIIKKGKTLGIVGESGCGKSVTAHAMLRITPSIAKITGQILYHKTIKGKEDEISDLAAMNVNGNEIRNIRGGEISMIFQEPMKAFSPIHTIGNQIIESILLHRNNDPVEARKIAIDVLRNVGMSNPEQRVDEYPHQLSGGMRQRAMIAMALCCEPAVLIADEPTTALDVTIQAQVLQLINDLKRDFNTSVVFITHDLGVIAEMCDDVAVMYLGKVVEYTNVDNLYYDARHPYTIALLGSIPSVTRDPKEKLDSIEGTVPFPMNLPKGCGFYTRCTRAVAGLCNVDDIPMFEVEKGHSVRCIRVQQDVERGEKV